MMIVGALGCFFTYINGCSLKASSSRMTKVEELILVVLKEDVSRSREDDITTHTWTTTMPVFYCWKEDTKES
jgi:hypothetical protein